MDALARCVGFDDTSVYVYSDGPRRASDEPLVESLRQSIRGLALPNLILVERERNLGLARSVVEGVSELCRQFGRAIVLEDDQLPVPATLRWFNQALDAYAEDVRVGAVSGEMIDVPAIRRHGRGVFLGHPASSSWAVWHRSWVMYDPECADWAEWMRLPDYRERFRARGAMRFEHMMRDHLAGRSQSWAIRWHASLAKHRLLVLHPPQAIAVPVRTDSRHASNGVRTAALLPSSRPWPGLAPPPLPDRVELDQWAIRAWANRFRYSRYGAAHALSSILYEWRHRGERRV
jgi:hypothetical protein